MNFRSTFLILILGLVTACYTSPYSKWQAHMPEDDLTSDQTKIELIIKSSSDLSSTGLAKVAKLYENQQEWQKAMSVIKLAIREEPMNSSYHSRKAKYAYELGQVSVAYREALTAYQLGSHSLKQSLDLAKMAVALSEFSIVDDIIDSLLIAYPKDIDVRYMAARKYDVMNNIELAGKYYEEVRMASPSHKDNILFYARFLVAQNNLELAREVLMDSLSDSNSKQYLMLQGDVYAKMERYDSAAVYYRQALNMSADTTAYNLTLYAYGKSLNYDSLISISTAAVGSYPKDRNYLTIAARNLDRKRLYNEALPYYLTLYEMDTLDTLVAEELSYLQRKIAYLQRQKVEQRKLVDSLSRVLPQITF